MPQTPRSPILFLSKLQIVREKQNKRKAEENKQKEGGEYTLHYRERQSVHEK